MRIGIISVYVDYHRRGAKNPYALQPQIGSLIAGLLPRDAEIEVINETYESIDFSRSYDLLFISALHPDFDRARQISHYFRRRGATTVYGGSLASSYPALVAPYFDAIVVGDPEAAVPELYRDFCAGTLKPEYHGRLESRSRCTPRFDLVAGKGPLSFALEATRGCPYTCDFCVLTGLGTRYEARAVESVLADIAAGQAQLRDKMPAWRRRVVGFTDNNLAGNLRFLREFCAAIKPLNLVWYCAVTFNVIANPSLVRLMAEAGCACVFVGLESFNPAALTDMHKVQNNASKTRAAIDCCRDHGIMVMSGLMLSPQVDTLDYIESLPARVRESGLHVPTFLCFEAPIPGTPHFHRLADTPGSFLPHALLRDFAGYTLVTRPHHATPEAFVQAYRQACASIYSLPARMRKLADDLPRFLRAGRALCALTDLVDMTSHRALPPARARTLLAGSDTPPPERVPLTDADFISDAQRDAILTPLAVTDANGNVLPCWRKSATPFAQPRPRVQTVHIAPPSYAEALSA